jgi:hypothetical protein
MPETDRIPDELVLAAISRAELHSGHKGVPSWSILDHLGVSRRSSAARQVRARLVTLEASAQVEMRRRHGAVTWALTSTGRRRLTRARNVPELPESPQHRRWREARVRAEQEIERLDLSAHDAVEAATDLLHVLLSDWPPSDEWFALSERLARSFKLLGVAVYCLREWNEPDDATADRDDYSDPSDADLDEDEQAKRRHRRIGRRNAQLWQEGR